MWEETGKNKVRGQVKQTGTGEGGEAGNWVRGWGNNRSGRGGKKKQQLGLNLTQRRRKKPSILGPKKHIGLMGGGKPREGGGGESLWGFKMQTLGGKA